MLDAWEIHWADVQELTYKNCKTRRFGGRSICKKCARQDKQIIPSRSLLTPQRFLVLLILSWQAVSGVFFPLHQAFGDLVCGLSRSEFPCLGDSLHSVQAFPHHDAIAWQVGPCRALLCIATLLPSKISLLQRRWVCLKIWYIPNYSHLIGIMIINHWV